MIISEDEYGFVSYQDFKLYSNKVADAIEKYISYDDCENYVLVINGDTGVEVTKTYSNWWSTGSASYTSFNYTHNIISAILTKNLSHF